MSKDSQSATNARVYGPTKPPSDFMQSDSTVSQSASNQNDDELGDLIGMITAGINYFSSFVS